MKEEFKITRQGKQYVLYAGLLDEFHRQFGKASDGQRYVKAIKTELLQTPNEGNGNVAIVKAVVEAIATGESIEFHGLGDASPENVGRNIVPHIIRMAETRAKARALRDAVNVGVAALEELSDGEEPTNQQPRRGKPKPYPLPDDDEAPTPISQGRQTRVSRDDELTPGGVAIGRANELIGRIIKAGHTREEVAPYIWKASPEAFEKKWEEYRGKEAGA